MNEKKSKHLRRMVRALTGTDQERKYIKKEVMKSINGQLHLCVSAVNDPSTFRGTYRKLKKT